MTAVAPWIPPDLRTILNAHPRHHRMLTEAFRVGVRHGQPYITTNPAIRSGQPCLNGTRLPVESVAVTVWLDGGVDAAADDYGITRHDALLACWYAGAIGLPGRRGSIAPTPLWRRRWGGWADSVHAALWSAGTLDATTVPDPPTQDEQL